MFTPIIKKKMELDLVRIFCLLVAMLLSFPLLGNNLFVDTPGLRVEIKLLRHVYYINQAIPVYFTVINAGPKPVTLNSSLYLYRNYRFRVRTLRNIEIKQRNAFFLYRMQTRNKAARVRKITLMPGERYGRVINIANRVQLVKPGIYEVAGYFYMHPLRTGHDFRVVSNSVRFRLRPPLLVQKQVRKYSQDRDAQLARRLSAGETVDFMISAKRRRDWPAYFRYMDLVKLIDVFQQFSGKYAAANFAQKQSVMLDFRAFLKKFPSERIISHFVRKTTVVRDKETLGRSAQVECEIVYKQKRLIERKVYFFSLYRRLGRWYIYKYYVLNK